MTTGGAVVGLTNLQIRVFLMEHTGLPPTVEVMAEGACAYRTEPIEFAYVFKLNGYHFL